MCRIQFRIIFSILAYRLNICVHYIATDATPCARWPFSSARDNFQNLPINSFLSRCIVRTESIRTCIEIKTRVYINTSNTKDFAVPIRYIRSPAGNARRASTCDDCSFIHAQLKSVLIICIRAARFMEDGRTPKLINSTRQEVGESRS